jgi:superfamily II DNA or RNA helicase
MPSASPISITGHFRPRITLQTLGRGQGLLGMRAHGDMGPRGNQVSVVQIDWLYSTDSGLHWQTPAPTGLLNRRPHATQELQDHAGQTLVLLRDLGAEADATDLVWELGLQPLSAASLQWRDGGAAQEEASYWSLKLEDAFGDFWAEELPRLRAAGWVVIVKPGFAHQSVPVDAWKLMIHPASGELVERAGSEAQHGAAADIVPMHAHQEGSWLLSLGIEIEGEEYDLVPMLVNLLQRDARWRNAAQVAAIDDLAMVALRAPGGKRIDAPAGPIKAIVSHMLELLTDPRRIDNQLQGPLSFSGWDVYRLEALRDSLAASQAQRAGEHGGWQLRGDIGLRSLAGRLRELGGVQAVAPPRSLGLTLRPYQLHGLAWLQYLRRHHLAGILADDMGLGKTAQALAHILLEKQEGRLDKPALVVLPTSLLFNWQAEARRIAPQLSVLVLQGSERSQDFARIPEHDLVLTSYPLLWRDIARLTPYRFHLLILDEAQTVKNPAARSAGAIRRIQARHRLCITGTPLENHLGELWAQFDFLMPGFLGDMRSFAKHWRRPIETNGETLRAQLLAQRVRPFLLRRKKAEVAAELPPRTEAVKLVQLQGQQRELYEAVRVAADEDIRKLLKRKGFDGAYIGILDALLKLRQVCCDPRLLKGQATPPDMERAKLELLCDMLSALVEEGRRVLVFSQFTELLELIAPELEALQLPWLAFTGQTPPAERGSVIARFQAGEAAVLLLSLKAGGVGLNLTAADTVILMDPWWNPAVEEQAIARAHRIGQQQPVLVYRLVVEGSIEERMLALQARKAALADGILGEDAGLQPKFGEAELLGLLAKLSR